MKLYYKSVGKGRPLIILHGLFGSSDNWMQIAGMLKDMYQVFLLDQRNHGRSPHSTDFSYSLMSDDLAAFIAQQELEKPTVLGHSMGGKTAMKFALQNPDLLNKLIVADIAPRQYPVHHGAILEGLAEIDAQKPTSRAAADEILADFVSEKEVRQFLLKNLYRQAGQDSFLWRINLPVLTEKIGAVGEKITAETPFKKPTLFLSGSESGYIAPTDKDDIFRLFPQASIEKIAQAGHWLHAEQPELFVQTLNNFLA